MDYVDWIDSWAYSLIIPIRLIFPQARQIPHIILTIWL